MHKITGYKGVLLWTCQYCRHENDESSTVYDNRGALRDDESVILEIIKTQRTSFLTMKASKNCLEVTGVPNLRKINHSGFSYSSIAVSHHYMDVPIARFRDAI